MVPDGAGLFVTLRRRRAVRGVVVRARGVLFCGYKCMLAFGERVTGVR